MKNIIRLSATFIFLVIIWKCANQLAPTGGEVDRIPPEVVEVFPADGTINYEEQYFEITFSEYVDKRSVQDAIFISPSIEGEIEYDWSGTTLEVSFEDTLMDSTTYTVTVGTDVVDLNNSNNMAEAFGLAFSTGDKIDIGIVTGKVYDKNPNGVMIYAYKTSSDTLNPIKIKPNYISQVGKNGKYKLMGLGEGYYRIFAVRDDFKDFLYNVEDDEYGSPYSDVKLTSTDTIFTNLDYFLSVEDSSVPHIQNVTMTDKYHFLVEFSEFIDSSKLSSKNFMFYDSTDNRKAGVKYVFKGKSKRKQIFLSIEDTLGLENDVYLFVTDLYDQVGNKLGAEALSVVVSDRPDTDYVNIRSIITKYPGNQIDFENPQITIEFDDGFDSSVAKTSISISDESDHNYPSKIEFIDDASFNINIEQKLKPKSNFILKIDFGKLIDAAGNKRDSIHTLKFSTVNDLDFTGVSGIVFSDHSQNVQLVLENINGRYKYSQNLEPDNIFNFEKVFPGKYLFWAFIDEDSNEVYNFGSIYPYESSEKFIFYTDTLNLRARWPVGDVNLFFDQSSE